MRYSRRETKLQITKRKENYPFMPLSYRHAQRITSTPKGFIWQHQSTTVASHQNQEFIPWLCPKHSPLQTPAIHSSHTSSFLLAQHSKLFYSNSHSWNQSTSSAVALLSSYPHTLPHTPFYQFYLSFSFFFFFNMAKPTENTFIIPFINPFRYSA